MIVGRILTRCFCCEWGDAGNARARVHSTCHCCCWWGMHYSYFTLWILFVDFRFLHLLALGNYSEWPI